MTEEDIKQDEEQDDEDFDFGDGIFTDNSEAIETLRRSAEELGINPDLVAPQTPEDDDKPRYKYYARDSCGRCYGRGILDVVLSPSKPKVHWRTEGVPGRISKRKVCSKRKLKRRAAKKYKYPVKRTSQPSREKVKIMSGMSPGNDLSEQWDTRKKEPLNFKSENATQSFCGCVRVVEI